jgi:N-acetylmuramoyl-L-alanine amidase
LAEVRRRLAALLIAGLFLGLPVQAASTSARGTTGPDAALYREAQAGLATLKASPKRLVNRAEWERVILRYRKVVARYPASGYADDALLAVGDLYRAMASEFKAPRYQADAAAAYRTLVQEYPSSSRGERALFSVVEIAKESGEPRRLAEAAKDYLETYPDSKRAGEVRQMAKPQKAAAPLRTATRPASPAPAPSPAPKGPGKPAEAPRTASGASKPGPAGVAPVRAADAKPAEAKSAAEPSPKPVEVKVAAVVPARPEPDPEPLPTPPPPGLAQVYKLRLWSGEKAARVVLDMEKRVPLKTERGGERRLVVELDGARLHPSLRDRRFGAADGQLEKVLIEPQGTDKVRVSLDLRGLDEQRVFYLDDPLRLVIDTSVRPAESAPAPAGAVIAQSQPPRPAPTPAPEAVRVEARSIEPFDADPEPDRLPSRRLPALALAATAPAPVAAVVAGAPVRPIDGRAPVDPRTGGDPKAAGKPPKPGDAKVAEVAKAPDPKPAEARPADVKAADARPAEPRPAEAKVADRAPEPRRDDRASAPHRPQVNRDGEFSLARQLGLGARRIVIDAGHGGHDPGTIGPTGLMEKDLVLDVALRLEKQVRGELGAEVVLTRGTDVFVPLEERTAIANSKGADLFLSIHANSSPNATARGIETYFLNFAKSAHAESVAARENAISAATLKDLQNLVKAITLNTKIDESRDFAASVQEALVGNLKRDYPVLDRGVHTAPFYVLIGANMPSVLAEIAFVSNPGDERLLKGPAYREQIAASLFAGVKSYLEALNRTQTRQLTASSGRSRVASKGESR